jgi:ubiquinone/menaquinone biosynthesis C-methylase UbiE
MTSSRPGPVEANHHADFPGFSGVSGLVAGLTMVVGRGDVSRLAADLAEVTADDRVVDVGCGPGAAARLAARRGADVIGVDPAPVMLKLARRLTHRAAPVSWVDGSAEAIPVLDGAATVLWSISTVHHWRDVDAGLAEAYRVLAPGGRLLVIERHTRPGAKGLASHGWTDDQVARFTDQCRAAGFIDVRVATHRRVRKPLLVVQADKP